MRYKTIVVHLDDSQRCDERVELAMGLGRADDAHIVGLYAVYEPAFPAIDATYVDDVRESFDGRERSRRDSFLASANRWDVSAEWRPVHSGDPAGLAVQVRHADLLVVGQHDPYDNGTLVPEGFMTDMLFASGCPLLMIPHAGSFTLPAHHVAIAWDASREAARALVDALPLLHGASHVSVIHIDRADRPPTPDAAFAELALHLDDHGIHAHIVCADRDPRMRTGEVLLSRLADIGADLLVMGAYARSRVREALLGGVTRTIASSMTVPVLMSH
jgi:nucleotide-binding universal stress UspA family protein